MAMNAYFILFRSIERGLQHSDRCRLVSYLGSPDFCEVFTLLQRKQLKYSTPHRQVITNLFLSYNFSTYAFNLIVKCQYIRQKYISVYIRCYYSLFFSFLDPFFSHFMFVSHFLGHPLPASVEIFPRILLLAFLFKN